MDFKLNTIYRGDCKDILSGVKSKLDKYFEELGYNLPDKFVDLIYMDPPFFSNRKYEEIWNDGSEIRCFNDSHWYSNNGKRRQSIDAYLEFMRHRIQLCYNKLKETGSFYLHCDWHASHYLKEVCDNIFGYNNFQNEIIWHYGLGAANRKQGFLKKHDTILYYTKSKNFTFNMLRGEITKQMKQKYCHNDKKGNYMMSYGKKYYLKGGKPLDDVWNIPTISPTSNERLGYPTQKPEKLLEVIIKASSNPGEVILDPFCGCGTAIAVAYKFDRQFIGIDCSQTACNLMQERLGKMLGDNEITIINKIKLGKESRDMQPFDFQNEIMKCIGGRINVKTGDKGIDGWDRHDNPIQIKQSDKVGRQIIDQFSSAIRRYYTQLGNKNMKMRGILICYSVTSGVWNEIARLEYKEDIDIEIITIKDSDSLEKSVGKKWKRIVIKWGNMEENV